ncbi:hypothetical protein BDW22DRAFT_1362111 [Trametopsis cervina]|nr:hypothetical protein BDW22DRAFT_1362111 [Trametopsis cervina]
MGRRSLLFAQTSQCAHPARSDCATPLYGATPASVSRSSGGVPGHGVRRVVGPRSQFPRGPPPVRSLHGAIGWRTGDDVDKYTLRTLSHSPR